LQIEERSDGLNFKVPHKASSVGLSALAGIIEALEWCSAQLERLRFGNLTFKIAFVKSLNTKSLAR